MKYKILVELTDDERAELRKAVKAHPLDYESGHWKAMSEDELKEALVYCIVSTQTRYEAVERFGKSNDAQRIWNQPISRIEKTLRKYGIRFPHKRAPWIASLAGKNVGQAIQKLENYAGGDKASARKARALLEKDLKDNLRLKGIGPKQISHLLTKWLSFIKELIPLDSRWDNFLRAKGLLKDYDDPMYSVYEELVAAIARDVDVAPAELDEAVWYAVGEASNAEKA